jgi:hypothetical protein
VRKELEMTSGVDMIYIRMHHGHDRSAGSICQIISDVRSISSEQVVENLCLMPSFCFIVMIVSQRVTSAVAGPVIPYQVHRLWSS